ncbi:MAG: helix-turn-helix transcriptional regulator [Neomegalonema sp.]|nr:helix-turn-helix transcriptional regulator [Neomegalonema sp.]
MFGSVIEKGVDRRIMLLIGIVALQSVSAAFFLGDVVIDAIGGEAAEAAAAGEDEGRGAFFEAAIAIALAIGVGFGALELRRSVARAQQAETALAAASGAFAEFIRAQFDAWRLTPAEADVALLALKGFETKEIAELRSSAMGTVRAQLAKIYAKAGVTSRGQLVSHFIDDLLQGPVATDR